MPFFALLLLLALPAAARNFYVDCASGSDTAAGTSETSAWRTLARVSSAEYAPGDSILLKRGTRCTGQLRPKGSGAEGHPIALSAFGDGPLPVIDASGTDAAVALFNQHDWII